MAANNMKNNIILADDDASIRFVLSKFLTKSGYQVRATDNAQTLLKWVKSGSGDVVLTDVHMGSDNIFTFVPELKKIQPALPIIIMSANTSVVTALKSGHADVFDYIPKPFDLDELEKTIKRALDNAEPENHRKSQRGNEASTPSMIGKSAIMQPVFRALSDYMSANVPVYIYGEVGTGKTHLANLLHSMGERAERPFIMFDDCETVKSLESSVINGDLCVDRVHELSKDRQDLLLRALEKNECKSNREAFRLIMVANQPLSALLGSGHIRADLFYRLSGGEIELPALSHRLEDIQELAAYFLKRKKKKPLRQGTLDVLSTYHWPGNVRELKSILEIISIKYANSSITPSIMKSLLNQMRPQSGAKFDIDAELDTVRAACKSLLLAPQSTEITPYVQALSWVEKPLIEEALQIVGGNKLRAAELLGIHRNTLRTKIKQFGIDG